MSSSLLFGRNDEPKPSFRQSRYFDQLMLTGYTTINIREDLHKRLKIAAIEKEMTAGEIIEQLVERHL